MSHNGTGVVDVLVFNVLSPDYDCQLVCFCLCMVLMVVDSAVARQRTLLTLLLTRLLLGNESS